MKPKILAIIPARGGSKGIIRKNLRLMNGKPLIWYQIKNALISKLITDIVVSSEDDEILEYANNFEKLHLRKRPENLAKDDVTLDPVILDAVTYIEKLLNKTYDVVITLQPTSPLLKADSLDKAIEIFLSKNLDTMIPVAESTHLYWRTVDEKLVPAYKDRVNRQWLPKVYKETGAFLITKREFITETSRFGKNVEIFVLDEVESIDIDSPVDWVIAESLMKKLKILFVVNGNKKMGLGHIYRSITLANRLIGHRIYFITYEIEEKAINLIKNAGYEIFTTKKEELINLISQIRPNIVINDILDTDLEYVRRIKDIGIFVVNFEDLGEGADEAHLVFNALYEKFNPIHTHRYGYEYECLNDRFLLYPPKQYNNFPNTLFICFGGVDQNNLTCTVLKNSPKIFSGTPIQKIIVVLGVGYIHKTDFDKLISSKLQKYVDEGKINVYFNVDNMPKFMRNADIAITSNGRTVFELAAMAIPTISIAQNDRETHHLFARYHQGIRYLGVSCNVTSKKILEAIKDIANSPDLRKKMYLAQLEASKVIRNGTKKVYDEIMFEYWKWKNERDQNWR